MWWGVSPRLLQGHSPSGEPHYAALVQTPIGSGEQLVNRLELSHHLLEIVFICLITAQLRSIVPGIECLL
ncbi:hypothetical protein SynBIOSE41_02485 [Synechococcus sp. BIOS-E4-1]|nr:hypothetical protein SynBIOSE41_02485 [Synechococcus sp. BIOS-E4-1]